MPDKVANSIAWAELYLGPRAREATGKAHYRETAGAVTAKRRRQHKRKIAYVSKKSGSVWENY